MPRPASGQDTSYWTEQYGNRARLLAPPAAAAPTTTSTLTARATPASTPASPPRGSDVRVVTFNIAHARRIPEAIAILRTHAPLRDMDVLALQEMDAPGVKAIAQALGLNYVYYPASRGPHDEHDMGEALLSPWPIEESWKVPLPHVTRSHGSRATWATRPDRSRSTTSSHAA